MGSRLDCIRNLFRYQEQPSTGLLFFVPFEVKDLEKQESVLPASPWPSPLETDCRMTLASNYCGENEILEVAQTSFHA